MNDLISRKALLAEYDRVHIGEPGKARKLIEDAPGVDAVEVVYCQDCARCKKGFCTIRKDSWGATLKVGLHDFCSDGERREEG